LLKYAKQTFEVKYMSLEQKVSQEMNAAVKSGDKIRLETMRSIRAAIIEFNKSGVDREMTPEDEQKIILNQAKKRKESIEMFKQGGRTELADKEAAELKILEEFLPKQLTEVEIIEIIKNIIPKTGALSMKDIGKVMPVAMKELAGKADGKLVQEIVKGLLGG
jgi:uncharacterized protein